MPNNKKETFSFIRQDRIIKFKEKEVSDFIIISDDTFTKEDWFSVKKFTSLANQLHSSVDTPKCEVLLKKTIQGNEDEGKKGQLGKALKITTKDDNYIISIYTQEYGKKWTFSHSHSIRNELLLSYTRVHLNNIKVLESKNKDNNNFTLNLD